MIYALGPFRLDTHDAVLFRGTEPVALGRRAVALLCALVERPGCADRGRMTRPGGRGQQSDRADRGAASGAGRGDARRGQLNRDHAPPRLSLHWAGGRGRDAVTAGRQA
jgi:hypothetical protein